jgi:hypothetical protein
MEFTWIFGHDWIETPCLGSKELPEAAHCYRASYNLRFPYQVLDSPVMLAEVNDGRWALVSSSDRSAEANGWPSP